jgi:two-component system, chemotaxis family, protein-glutamate methylesterase/glutaminase
MRWNRRDNGFPANRLLPSKQRTALNQEGIPRDVIVIGASAGGVTALAQLFEQLPGDLPAIIGVVLHRGAPPSELASVLGRRSALPLIEPSGRQSLKKGRIYLAPSDHHLLFGPDSVTIHRGPKEHSTRPAVDPLFRSAAEAYGRRVVGALLTGCGEDGVSGLIAISDASGVTIAQDPEEAYMPYMPLNALRYDSIGGIFSLDEMTSAFCNLAKGKAVLNTKVPSTVPSRFIA